MNNSIYLIYFLLAAVLVYGARLCKTGEWNEEYTSLGQMKMLEGAAVLLIAFHHMAQKTCGEWHEARYIVHGLDFFCPIGYALCAVFLFASGYGLYVSVKTRPGYLEGFVRRRILPLVIAYYLSEFVYLGVRLLMGERMSALTVLWYASGLHMANFNAWYLVAAIFFTFVFFAAFRLFKTDAGAIGFVFAVTLLYTFAGLVIDHQENWFMRGEWWYNSIILFPVGMLFARSEPKITAFLKRRYLVCLILALAGLHLAFAFSQQLNATAGYYGETWGDPYKLLHRLECCSMEWLVSILFVATCLLILLKMRFGNRLFALLGRTSLAFYLMHGMFVELFGFNFLDAQKSLRYIKKVPPYVFTVLACSAVATFLFHSLWKKLCQKLRT